MTAKYGSGQVVTHMGVETLYLNKEGLFGQSNTHLWLDLSR